MKIGIACFGTSGGSGSVAVGLGQALASLGHSVDFIAPHRPPRLACLSERVQFQEVRGFDYPLFDPADHAFALAAKLADVGQRKRLDLVHAHYALPHAVSACLARELLRGRFSLPVITTLHGTDVTILGRDPSTYALAKYAMTQSDGLTTVSNFLAGEIADRFQVPGVRVIPNFVDTDNFQPGASVAGLRERLAPSGEKLIMHISNFRPIKQAGHCVQIFSRIRRKIRCRLVMVGDGPEVHRTQELARELGVERDVVFVGEQAGVVDYLRVASLLLLPSKTESFGLAAREAMSCEVPVVASLVGGLPEVVDDGISGRLLPCGDLDGMAVAAAEILANEKMGASFGRAGRATAINRFSADRVVPLYLEYYRQVIDQFKPAMGAPEARFVR